MLFSVSYDLKQATTFNVLGKHHSYERYAVSCAVLDLETVAIVALEWVGVMFILFSNIKTKKKSAITRRSRYIPTLYQSVVLCYFISSTANSVPIYEEEWLVGIACFTPH